MQDLGTMNNDVGDNYYAYGINEYGQAVGNAGLTGDGVLYAGGHAYDLNTLVTGLGWKLETATAINNAGQIVGFGINPSGQTHAFLLNPAGLAAIVVTLPATTVATTTARLNGSLIPIGNSTTAHFEYGTTTTYGNSTTSGILGTTSQAFGFSLSGLSPNTTYHYRLDASNSVGSVAGNDVLFTTSPLAAASKTAFVFGTGGIGLRLRASASLSATVLAVMPDGSQVTLLGDTQTTDGYFWRNVQYGTLTGWAADEYLVFGALSAAPTPPSGLQQFEADGATAIVAGGSTSANSVVLSATVGRSSSQQYIVQFEVRPIGAAFFTPTYQSGYILDGALITVSPGGLLNQGYHWQARTLDGNGHTSSWTTFGTGTSSDFTVSTPVPITALFSFSPVAPTAGSTIQFTANTASGTGWTFQWDFGDGQKGTGSTVPHTYSASGPEVVTLTVSDGQGHQNSSTLSVPVASGTLQDVINELAQETSTYFEQVYTSAGQTASAADYFQGGVDDAESEIAISGTFSLLSLGMDGSTYLQWIKDSTGQDAAGVGIEAAEQKLADWTYSQIVNHTSVIRLREMVFAGRVYI